MDGKRDGVGVRVYVQGGELAKRSFDDIADSGTKMFAEIAVGARTANPAIVALNNASEKTADGMEGAGRAAGTSALGLGLMATAGVAVGAAMAGAAMALQKTREAMEMGDEIADTAAKLQIGTTALQEWRFMALKAGVATEAMDAALGKFSEKFGEAKLGQGDSVKWFEALGLDKTGLETMDDVDAALTEVLKRIGEVGGAAERAAIAEKLGLSDLLPMANAGQDALAKFRKEAEELGYVIDEELIRRLADANDQTEVLSQVINAHLAVAFADLAPILVQTLQLIADITGQIGDMIDKVKDFRRETQRNWMRQPEWVRNTASWMMRGSEAGRLTAQGSGIDPDTGLPTDDFWASMQSPDRSFTVPPKPRKIDLPDKPTRRASGPKGPTAAEIAADRERAKAEYDLALARAKGDEATSDLLETEKTYLDWREKLVRGRYDKAEADAMARRLADEDAWKKRQQERLKADADWIRKNTEERPDGSPNLVNFGLDGKVVGPDGTLWTAEQKQAWARSVGEATAEGLDIALQGGDVWEWLKQRFYQSALDGVASGIEQAMMNSQIGDWFGSAGGNDGGWGGVVSGIMGLLNNGGGSSTTGSGVGQWGSSFAGRATGGSMDPGGAYRLGEHGQPELFMAGNGYVANAEATQRMLADAMSMAQEASGARGGGGPRKVEVTATFKLEVPAGYVPDASMGRMLAEVRDSAVSMLAERVGELASDQQAEYFVLKG